MSSLSSRKPKIALVHDYLTCFGGAERVLRSLHGLYPEAPIYVLLYDESKMKKYFPKAKIRPSFLDKFPKFIRKRKKYLLPLLPTAAETFNLRDYDIVISSCSSFVKGIITKPKTVHICYCHAPTRFLWDWRFNYLEENKIGKFKKLFLVPLLHYLRMWDRSAAERVDYFIANSQNTADKIKKFYGRESKVIYPPAVYGKSKIKSPLSGGGWGWVSLVENPPPTPPKRGIATPSPSLARRGKLKNYFLIVSRLSPYKKIDLAVEAFNKLELPLYIIGEGSDRKRLEEIAEKNIKFLGFQAEDKLAEYYQNCQALIFPGEDDFGMTIVEAMAAGKPALAFRKGGALEIVKEGETGEFFDYPIPELLADGIRRLRKNMESYDAGEIRLQAEKFSRERFEREMELFINELTNIKLSS